MPQQQDYRHLGTMSWSLGPCSPCRVHAGLDPKNRLAIVTTIDDEVEAYMAGGGTVLRMDPDPATRSYLARFGL